MDNQEALSVASLLQAYATHCYRNPSIRRKDGILHVSDVSSSCGWSCDRYIEYIRTAETRVNAVSHIPLQVWPVLWVGQGIEQMLDNVLDEACQTSLPALGFTLVSLEKQPRFEDKELGLVGHADYVLTYRTKSGEQRRQVIDAKSTSPARDAKRAIGSQGKAVSRADLDHIRQVAIYKHYFECDYGSLLYVTKSGVPRISDGFVDGSKVVPLLQQRLRRIDEEMSSGCRPIPSRGTYCSDCRWSQLCESEGI